MNLLLQGILVTAIFASPQSAISPQHNHESDENKAIISNMVNAINNNQSAELSNCFSDHLKWSGGDVLGEKCTLITLFTKKWAEVKQHKLCIISFDKAYLVNGLRQFTMPTQSPKSLEIELKVNLKEEFLNSYANIDSTKQTITYNYPIFVRFKNKKITSLSFGSIEH